MSVPKHWLSVEVSSFSVPTVFMGRGAAGIEFVLHDHHGNKPDTNAKYDAVLSVVAVSTSIAAER